MAEKTEAQRLADAICDYSRCGHESEEAAKLRRMNSHSKAAAELRRLEEAYDWQYKMAGDRLRRIEKLERINAQLLEALEKLARLGNGDLYGNSQGNMIARAAIEAAHGITGDKK